MTVDTLVEGSLEWAALSADDLPQLAELRTAIEYFDDPVERLSLEELQESFRAPGADPTRHAVVGRDKGGTIVAYGWNHLRGLDVGQPHVWLDGGVHPAWRHQHIGRKLVTWQVECAQEWYAQLVAEAPEVAAPLVLGRYVDEKLTGQAHLMEHLGFTARRWYFDMHVTFGAEDTELRAPSLPAMPPLGEVQLEPYHPLLSERVRLAHNEAFADSPGTHLVSEQDWQYTMTRGASRPQWSWVARVGDEVVGYAMNSAYLQDWEAQGFSEGWTDRLGVRPGWRGRNLGHALLIASMRTFLDAGLDGAGLGVDTSHPDGALGLFEAIGYESEEMVVRYELALPADGSTA